MKSLGVVVASRLVGSPSGGGGLSPLVLGGGGGSSHFWRGGGGGFCSLVACLWSLFCWRSGGVFSLLESPPFSRKRERRVPVSFLHKGLPPRHPVLSHLFPSEGPPGIPRASGVLVFPSLPLSVRLCHAATHEDTELYPQHCSLLCTVRQCEFSHVATHLRSCPHITLLWKTRCRSKQASKDRQEASKQASKQARNEQASKQAKIDRKQAGRQPSTQRGSKQAREKDRKHATHERTFQQEEQSRKKKKKQKTQTYMPVQIPLTKKCPF